MDGTEATYTQADDADASEVIYEARPDGVKESIVLDERPASAVRYTFDLALSAGLTPKLRATGEIDVVDAREKQAFTMPAPFMTDANNTVSTNVRYDLASTSSGWQLVVTPSDGWLHDPDRVYPVIVDPTVVRTPTTDGWIAEANPTTVNGAGAYLRVGGVPDSRRRALLKFDLTGIPDDALIQRPDEIDPARLMLSLDPDLTVGDGTAALIAGRVKSNQPWAAGHLSWNNREYQTAWESPGGAWGDPTVARTYNIDSPGYKSIDVKAIVQRWVNDHYANNGFIVKQATDVDKTLWFHSVNTTTTSPPKLVITYDVPDHAPTTPTNLSITPGGTGYTTAAAPTLTVNASDPDETPVDVTFKIVDATAVVWQDTVAATPPPVSSASVQIPEGVLAPGADYTLRVSAASGGVTSTALASPFRADLFAARQVAGGSCGECTAISPTVVFSANVPANGTTSIPLASLPVDQDNLLSARLQIDINSHASTGGLRIYRDDYPTPLARTISFSNPDPVTRTVEVYPSSENTIGLQNFSGTTAAVTATVLSWTSAITDEDREEDEYLETMPLTVAEDAAIDLEQDPVNLAADPITQADIVELGHAPALTFSETVTKCTLADDQIHEICIDPIASPSELETSLSDTTPGKFAAGYQHEAPLTTQAERAGFSGCPYQEWRILRFNSCFHFPVTYEWKTNGRVDGRMVVQVELKVQLAKRDTPVDYRVRMLLSEMSGVAGPHQLEITSICGGECTEPSERKLETMLFTQLNRSDTVTWGFLRRPVVSGQRVTGLQLFGMNIIETPMDAQYPIDVGSEIAGRVPFIRCDQEPYISYNMGIGCVFVGFEPTFHLSLRGDYPHTANNVWQGILDMGGFGMTVRPLKRLAGIRGGEEKKKIAKNRREARKLCRTRFPNTTGSCDEYPMASTYQGCWLKKDYEVVMAESCHVGRIPLADNTGAGRKLNRTYLSQRILNGDYFWVRIHE